MRSIKVTHRNIRVVVLFEGPKDAGNSEYDAGICLELLEMSYKLPFFCAPKCDHWFTRAGQEMELLLHLPTTTGAFAQILVLTRLAGGGGVVRLLPTYVLPSKHHLREPDTLEGPS